MTTSTGIRVCVQKNESRATAFNVHGIVFVIDVVERSPAGAKYTVFGFMLVLEIMNNLGHFWVLVQPGCIFIQLLMAGLRVGRLLECFGSGS